MKYFPLVVLLVFLGLTLAPTNTAAQSSQSISYVSIARSSKGKILSSKPIGVQVVVHAGAATGAETYIERHTITTGEDGTFTIPIGAGTSTLGNFSKLDWHQNQYFATIAIDDKGGTTYRDILTAPLAAPKPRSSTPPDAPTQFAFENERVSGKIKIEPTGKDHLIGNAKLKLTEPSKVYISGAVSFQPPPVDVEWIGVNVQATHPNGAVVNSSAGNLSNYEGAAKGQYTTIERSAILNLPHAGEWTIQLMVHKTKDGVTMDVHTYNISAFPLR